MRCRLRREWNNYSASNKGPSSPELPIVFHAATYDPDTFEMTQELVGAGGETYVHTADIYALDFEYKQRPFGENEQVVEGGRVVRNLFLNSRKFDAVEWNLLQGVSGPTLISGGGEDGEDVYQFEVTGSATGTLSQLYSAGPGIYNCRFKVRCIDGVGNCLFYIRNVNGEAFTLPQNVWRDLSSAVETANTGNMNSGFKILTSSTGVTYQISVAQLEVVSALSVPPSDYIDTTTAPVQKVFATTNGNSVTDNVVTEADGVPLDPLPMLVYQPAATNIALQSNVFSLQNSVNVSITDDQTGITAGKQGSRVTCTGNGVTCRISQLDILTDNTPFTVKFWCRYGSAKFIYLYSVSAVLDCFFDVELGVVGTVGAGVTVSMTPQNGGYLCIASFPAAAGTNRLDVGMCGTDNARQSTTTGEFTDYLQVEVHNNKTIEDVINLGPIFTEGTEQATDETIITHAAANHDNAEGTYTGTIDYAGDDTPVLSLGGVPFLEILSTSDRVVDPYFNDATEWNTPLGWTVVGGVANSDGSGGDLAGVNKIEPLTEYNVVVDVTGTFLGPLRVRIGANNTNVYSIAESGRHEFTITSTNGPYVILRYNVGDFVGDVTEFSIKLPTPLLRLTDGTNATSLPITVGKHDFEAYYNAAAGEMQLKLDAATSAVTVYDGTLGTGEITIDETGRDFKRFDTSEIV